MKQRLLLVMTIVACAVIIITSIALAAVAKTRITIRGTNGDYHGKIFSPDNGCLAGRSVIVFKMLGNGQDPANDTNIGTDTSSRDGDHGVWSIGNSGFKHGNFYAKAKKTPNCRPDLSNVISR